MPNPRWIFEPVGPMGGATGTAFRNTLQGTGKSGEEQLAREAIQNSCDAADPEKKVRVVFRCESLDSEPARAFSDALQLEEGLGRHLRYLQLPRTNWLANRQGPLHLTYVEDYGTVGLNGDPHTRESNFYKLLLSMGDVAKATQMLTGGSYGYGKAALSMNSKLYTIVAYSSFAKDGTGSTARLMACGYFEAHTKGKTGYTGRAWFGIPEGKNSWVSHPLRNEEAHEMAIQLGFERRDKQNRGTSLLLVDSPMDPALLIKGIETSWWPRIIDHELEVEVKAGGESLFPRPKRRKDLAAFIECYGFCVGTAEANASHQRSETFRKLGGASLGSWGMQVIGDETAKEFEEEELVGTVALLRSPKMIVHYAQMARDSPAAIGVFVADGEIDEILKLSEPPPHDRWDEKSPRLGDANPDEETARTIVRQLHVRLKAAIRKLQVQTEPPRPVESSRLRAFERELGLVFRPGTRGDDGGPQDVAPVEVHFTDEPQVREVKGGMLETYAKVGVRLRADADVDQADSILRIRVAVLQDERGTEGDLLPVNVAFDQAGQGSIDEIAQEGGERRYLVVLSKDRWTSFSIRSDPYDSQWATKVGVELESPEDTR